MFHSLDKEEKVEIVDFKELGLVLEKWVDTFLYQKKTIGILGQTTVSWIGPKEDNYVFLLHGRQPS